MTDIHTTPTWAKPLPEPDPVNREYWAAAAQGRLLIQSCPSCGHRQFYPRSICEKCAGKPEWMECSGAGHIHTFTIIRQMGLAPFSNEVPYVVAMIELDEGPLMMGNVTGCDPDDVRVGQPVRVYFVPAAEGIGIPMWSREDTES